LAATQALSAISASISISSIRESVRTAPYEAANAILTKPLKGATALKSWGMKLAKRAGRAKAKVALARKLSVILHRMWGDGTTFADKAISPKSVAA
jgi:transposase